jgi:hypothetical protein
MSTGQIFTLTEAWPDQDTFTMNNLLGISPAGLLIHGPKKTLLNAYHWHLPDTGIVASYSPTARDVEDHFGVFRGVDQIEAFAQATIVSCSGFLECIKQKCDPEYLKGQFYSVVHQYRTGKFQKLPRRRRRFHQHGKDHFLQVQANDL